MSIMSSHIGIPGVLYHYTSLAGLIGIIRDKVIWASSIYHLNDASEFDYIFRLLEKTKRKNSILNVLKDELEAYQYFERVLYVTSFSEEEDSLSQWREYCGGGSGFAIGLDLRDLNRSSDNAYEIKKCIYDKTTQIKILKDCLKNKDAESSKVPILNNACIFKDNSFKAENEWRLFLWHSCWLEKEKQVKFRAGKSIVVPYIEIPYCKFVIREVVIGPTPHPRRSEMALKVLLSANGYATDYRKVHGPVIEIKHSQTPYSYW